MTSSQGIIRYQCNRDQFHVSSILSKLGIASRTEAVSLVLRHNLFARLRLNDLTRVAESSKPVD